MPADDFGGTAPKDFNLAADFLELSAFLSGDGNALTQSIGESLELACDSDFASAEEATVEREDIESGAAPVILERLPNFTNVPA